LLRHKVCEDPADLGQRERGVVGKLTENPFDASALISTVHHFPFARAVPSNLGHGGPTLYSAAAGDAAIGTTGLGRFASLDAGPGICRSTNSCHNLAML
jgi:hypothetical protein